jgi:HK97 family phage prohead protease
MLEHKTFGLALLETKGKKEGGAFEAIVSVFGNVDRENDRMQPGAFKRTLQPPSEGGRGYPAIVYAHQWTTVPIGVSAKCEEVAGVEVKDANGSRKVDGLFVDAELFVGETQLATEVYTAMSRKGGDGLPALRDFSFGYRPTATGAKFVTETINGKSTKIRDLSDVDLWEVGPCLVGMNPETQLLGTKGFDDVLEALFKAGARNSSTDADRLQAIHDMAVENGAECAAAKALMGRGPRGSEGKIYNALRAKGYEDIDSWSVYRLADMIEDGTSFISSESDPIDVAKMRGILNLLVAMLADEVNEQGETADPVSPDELLEMASLPTSGTKSHAANAALTELLLAHPLV